MNSLILHMCTTLYDDRGGPEAGADIVYELRDDRGRPVPGAEISGYKLAPLSGLAAPEPWAVNPIAAVFAEESQKRRDAKTPIELFGAGVRGWATGLRGRMDDRMSEQGSPRCFLDMLAVK
jgi:hypothetical protein